MHIGEAGADLVDIHDGLAHLTQADPAIFVLIQHAESFNNLIWLQKMVQVLLQQVVPAGVRTTVFSLYDRNTKHMPLQHAL